jgi:DNA-binding beta-propeller fold protein YncE
VPAKAALHLAAGVAVSPDGRSVYVVSTGDDSITSFVRAADGSLSFQGCFADTAAAGCAVPDAPVLDGAYDVAVSPDGRSVYVTSFGDDSLTWFSRANDGSLTFKGCQAKGGAEGCAAPLSNFDNAEFVVVSPDGGSIYVTATLGDSLTQFDRTASGEPTFKACFSDQAFPPCTVPSSAVLDFPSRMAISPNGESLYVISLNDDAVSHFTRAGDGTLAFQRCFADTAADGCGVPTQAALEEPAGVAVSPDGGSVYVSAYGDKAVSSFARAASGALAFSGCLADGGTEGCRPSPRPVMESLDKIATTNAGNSVYATSTDGTVSTLTPGPDGILNLQSCLVDADLGSGCTVPFRAALANPQGLAVSPDDTTVYVTSVVDSAVSQFSREQAPLPPTEVPPTSTPDTTAPETAKGDGPKRKVKTHKRKVKVSFEFSSTEPDTTFQCSLDSAAANACTSPAQVKIKAKHKKRKHTFSVAAVDASGNVDQSPVLFAFKVQRKP